MSQNLLQSRHSRRNKYGGHWQFELWVNGLVGSTYGVARVLELVGSTYGVARVLELVGSTYGVARVLELVGSTYGVARVSEPFY